ncbi:unnamed protein product [Peronospora belbahrii]|uniref:Uncharacterized protein n=1 Tax=Peronospora belbahrii TaxID=622444 RepID=A0AAU9L0D6_9STRA|nr:unnamed protein product [Peronospora belbahrii]
MIYPKTIFQSAIALSTVAASTKVDVVRQNNPTHGVKHDKGGRYIDTTDSYGTTSTSVLSSTAYAAKNQTDNKLRKVTSPDSVGVKFSYASPTNANNIGHIAAVGHSLSPRTLDHVVGKKGAQKDVNLGPGVSKSDVKKGDNNTIGVKSKYSVNAI